MLSPFIFYFYFLYYCLLVSKERVVIASIIVLEVERRRCALLVRHHLAAPLARLGVDGEVVVDHHACRLGAALVERALRASTLVALLRGCARTGLPVRRKLQGRLREVVVLALIAAHQEGIARPDTGCVFLFHAAPPAIRWFADHDAVGCLLDQRLTQDGVIVTKPIAHQFLANNCEMLEAEPMRVMEMGVALAQSSMV